MNKTRVRFSPSPTGFLHVGSLRTVLFNYLIAKKYSGDFILRIEDTDQKRKVEGAVEGLLDILGWLGIKFDEGPHAGGDFGPYIQSERLDIYKKYVQELINKGEAYYCFCSSERLQKMREEQQAKKLPPRYDRACRDLSPEEVKNKLDAGEKYVIRQKMPLEGEVIVHDELRGEIKFPASDLEDQILVKGSGWPTYQLASVIDDHLMQISYVLRGEEWIPSLPKNVLLYKSFGWEVPKFIHLPLTLNKNGGKLSKRQGDVAVEDYRRKGYLPEALINFSVLQGWHPKGDNEILSLDEMIKEFEIKDMRVSGGVFDIEKLDYFNGFYIRQKNKEELAKLCEPFLKDILSKSSKEKQGEKFIANAVALAQDRLKMLSEVGELIDFLFADELSYPAEMLVWKKSTPEETKNNLEEVYKQLEKIPEENWTDDSIEEGVVSYIKSKDAKVGDYLWPMRVALTGRERSPGPFEVAEVLGKDQSLERVKKGAEKL